MYEIKLIEPNEIEVIIPFLQILDSGLETDELKKRLPKMIANNYACIGIYVAEKLVGISGFWLIQKYYTGQYIEPDNVVIDPNYRGKGFGEMMSKWIDNYAESIGCIAANLNVYTTNEKAIKFWLNQGYKIISFHLQKKYKK
jgi:GNAT superfamily N-acetyltransferase